jgi:alpha-L-fucosidase
MFVTWGLYSIPAQGEWRMYVDKVPVDAYAALAKRLNPVRFDAEQWVLAAKNAGMKYMIVTAKHHDGFAMFVTKASPFNIVDATPFKRDPLKELAQACRRHGMKLGFYYSQCLDWHHPGGSCGDQGPWDKTQVGDFDAYVNEVAIPQVRELLGNYGPDVPAVLWYDMGMNAMTRERAERFVQLMAGKPEVIWNDRLGGGFAGDFDTPEQFVPATGYSGRGWETCMTINDHWGYCDDGKEKTAVILLHHLVDIASKGGNYLLNVGPSPEGLIPGASLDRLRQIGAWMRTNGEGIYGTSASPFKSLPWGRCTRKNGKLYLHVFDWPKDGALVVPMAGTAIKAWLLAEPGTKLTLKHSDAGVTVSLPVAAPDPIVSVVVLKIEGDVKPIEDTGAGARPKS